MDTERGDGNRELEMTKAYMRDIAWLVEQHKDSLPIKRGDLDWRKRAKPQIHVNNSRPMPIWMRQAVVARATWR